MLSRISYMYFSLAVIETTSCPVQVQVLGVQLTEWVTSGFTNVPQTVFL